MAGRTPHEAIQNYLRPLQLALSCVTSAVLVQHSGDPNVLTLPGGNAARLGGESKLMLRFVQHYGVVEAAGERGPWKASIEQYAYALEDRESRELLAYHWHPATTARIAWPHLHMGPAAGVRDELLQRAHLPTGRVSFEDFLSLVIRDLGVKPRRRDWEQVLRQTQRAFERYRTWAGSGR
jgi:hypothetical protein